MRSLPRSDGGPRPAVLVVCVLLFAAGAGAGAGPAAAAAPKRLAVGAATLKRCADDGAFVCGRLSRPLDPQRPRGRRISIAFRWRPADAPRRRSGPPIVAVEGGPGYPSTGSSVEYTGIAGPLLRTRDLLLVDNRGTGGSALIRCPGVQRFTGRTDTVAFAGRVAGCARTIDRRYGRGAHERFGTADAVDDLAAVLRHLRLPPVALYGDSYGTFFAQSFMARHPRALNSVVLDSSYPVRDLDPFYASSVAVMRDAFDAVCARDAGCAAATGDIAATAGDGATPADGVAPADTATPVPAGTTATPSTATARLAALLDRLRTAPLRRPTRDADGSGITQTVTPRTIVDLAQWAASDPVIYRELDPAVRAALAGDDVPLVRLAAQASTWNGSPSPATYYSDGLYYATSCVDYPQLFSMTDPPAARRAQLAASTAAAPAAALAPFGVSEWLSMDAGSEPFRACLDWPAIKRVRPPVPAAAKPLPASVPILVVGGDLDSLTPLRDAETFAPTLGAKVRVVELANTVHVTSEGDTTLVEGANCGRRVIRAFWRVPGRVEGIDARCGAAIPPVHTAGAYPRELAAAAPATLTAGPDPGEDARRAATVAAGAVGDAIARRTYLAESGTVPGLRGGAVRVTGAALVRFKLERVRFTADATVTGTARWVPARGTVSARVRVVDELGTTTRLTVGWTQRSRLARALVDGATLALPAP